MTNAIFTHEQNAAAVERLKKKLAARQAAKEAVERIAAGVPRSSFGKFALSFEEIVPDFAKSVEKSMSVEQRQD
jgi:uncharacterized protein YoaH (UPF0181 family)